MVIQSQSFSIVLKFECGTINSLIINGSERLTAPSALFRLRLADPTGERIVLSSLDATACEITEDGAIYGGFSQADLSVQIFLKIENDELLWNATATPKSKDYYVEWIEYPTVTLPPLKMNDPSGKGGTVLFPYNEGALVSDINSREACDLRYAEPEYPSKGCYSVFPNMICTQMLAYLWNDCGLYIGAHDPKRGVKDINFKKSGDGVELRIRIYTGADFGASYSSDFPIVFAITEGKWESAAERYRKWFEENLPPKAKKISQNEALPEWYEDSPLVVTYPVRGIHDMDTMTPNKLFPYSNALPILEEIRKASQSRLLVLLMHWEGTAPWAPPYVWPPFGGESVFNEFKKRLHDDGDLLGVYCSGFGYTIQSNLIDSYNKKDEYEERNLVKGMCADADTKVKISRICTGQRSGYDICPASKTGRELLIEAYQPLLKEDLDYVQILDQNHGGGQYFCYSREHGHPPCPGPWMTQNMQSMLSEWNEIGRKTLLGCESAAAEPFIGNLLFSDNRFELNYKMGVPVPLYNYIYHEYLRNFMGNQVSCPFEPSVDTLRYRLAYSFAIGDSMTLVMTPDGDLMANWGTRDFTNHPDREKALRMIRNLVQFYKEEAKKYLYNGRMIETPAYTCGTVSYPKNGFTETVKLPAILATAWEAEDGSQALILVNPEEHDLSCSVMGKERTVAALSAAIIDL